MKAIKYRLTEKDKLEIRILASALNMLLSKTPIKKISFEQSFTKFQKSEKAIFKIKGSGTQAIEIKFNNNGFKK